MSPLGIEIMLHCYYTPAPWPRPSPAADECIRTFLEMELIVERVKPIGEGQGYAATGRGAAFVEALMDVPLPVAAWIIPPREEFVSRDTTVNAKSPEGNLK